MQPIAIYMRPGCHLCDEAESLVRGLGGTPELIDIEADDQLHRRFLELIPVIEIGGEHVAELIEFRSPTFADRVRAHMSD